MTVFENLPRVPSIRTSPSLLEHFHSGNTKNLGCYRVSQGVESAGWTLTVLPDRRSLTVEWRMAGCSRSFSAGLNSFESSAGGGVGGMAGQQTFYSISQQVGLDFSRPKFSHGSLVQGKKTILSSRT